MTRTLWLTFLVSFAMLIGPPPSLRLVMPAPDDSMETNPAANGGGLFEEEEKVRYYKTSVRRVAASEPRHAPRDRRPRAPRARARQRQSAPAPRRNASSRRLLQLRLSPEDDESQSIAAT